LYLSEDIGNLQVQCRTNLNIINSNGDNSPNSQNSWEDIDDEFKVEEDVINKENKGCDWTGKLYDLKHHINNDCQYFQVLCNHSGCTLSIQRGLLEEHSNNCSHRLEKCDYCKNLYKFSNLENHKLSCTERPEPCLNNCGIVVPHSKLVLHYENCPLHLVNCPLGIHCNKSCPKELLRKGEIYISYIY
jgi:hypothetical protein